MFAPLDELQTEEHCYPELIGAPPLSGTRYTKQLSRRGKAHQVEVSSAQIVTFANTERSARPKRVTRPILLKNSACVKP
ncbi:hypothetical protein [Phaeobacter gallaeciensis]|uniref:hypothetical protein n=1 Tax=Phaeobacter gallaeciensis TaxID=60890 RepID=UPI00237FBBD8|nr:hypothetical protein [Phaeobacter gallaeciensis]